MFGSLIACGLEIRLNGNTVMVEAGMALDCCGREIVVPDAIEVRIPRTHEPRYLLLSYIEHPVDPVPVNTQENETQYTRIREAYDIEWSESDPHEHHERTESHWICCHQPHPISLARLVYARDRTWLDAEFAATIPRR